MYNKNSSDNIFLDEPSGELTFGKIFKVIKFAFVRALVYILIACIIAGGLSLILTAVGNKDSVSTTIEFSYDGINQGLTPSGDKFSINRIKNTTVLDAAIANVKIDDKSKLDTRKLYSHIKTKEVIPGDVLAEAERLKAAANTESSINSILAGMEYYPTNFVIYIDEYKDLGLREKDAIALLNEIIKAYQVEWINSYVVPAIPDNSVFADIIKNGAKEEFVMYDSILSSKYDSLLKYLEYNKDTKFRSSDGETYDSLISELATLPSQIDMFNSYVVNNKAVKNGNDVINLLVAEESSLKAEMKSLSDAIKNTKEYLDAWKPNSSITKNPSGGADTVVNSYPPEYTAQMKSLDRLIVKQAELSVKKDTATRKLYNLGYYKDAAGASINESLDIKPNEDVNAVATNMLNKISTNFNNIIAKTTKLSAEYKENTPITKDINMVLPVANSNERIIGNKVIIGIFIIAVVIAGIAALVVTVNKQKEFAFSKFFSNKTNSEEKKETTNEVVEDNKTTSDEE